MQSKVNLQDRKINGLSELGEKIFLDRYAVKDVKRETLAVGDTVVVLVNPKTGQREIGIIENIDISTKEVTVKMRDGQLEYRRLEHVDKPLELVPEQMFDRIAKHIASVEKLAEKRTEWEDKFRKLMDDWKYVPAGRIFTGAGTGQNLTFYNCYVIPHPKDSRQGIFETLGQMAEIMSRGGGVGINVSSLRPRYAYVKGVNGRSSGAVSWASLYSFVTGLIEQGGSRRGALMLILNCWHPDVIDFINSKKEAGKITNANISVGITDDFMDAVKNDKPWDLVFPDTSDPLYATKWDGNIKRWKELGGKIIKHKTVRAADVWDNIITSAWSSAEPGMYFIDRANYFSNSHYFADLPCTNPCGEQPLPAWGVCNLGHVNLSKHINKDSGEVMWNELKQTVQYAVRFQDNVIDATPYFFDENKDQQMSERRVGMGTIGLAEMMIYKGVKYGSPEAVEFIDKLYQFIAVTAYETSVELAREKGAFPMFDAEKFLQSGYMKAMPAYIRDLVAKYGIRNVTILTQAPTGTVGTMVGTSTGIEPFFSWTYFRKSRLGVHEEKIKLAQDYLEKHPGQDLPSYFTTAMELMPEEHVRVQAAVQRWTDSAISKTCNAPADYTVEQTKQLYTLMYDLGCKGGTIYRDGSRDEQILATDHKKLGKDASDQVMAKQELDKAIAAPSQQPNPSTLLGVSALRPQEVMSVSGDNIQIKLAPRSRPDMVQGITYKMQTAYGNLYVTINEDTQGPLEVFAVMGKAGGFFSAQTEAITRMISLALRSNVAVEEIIDQLKGIRSPDVSFSDGGVVFSLPDAIAKILEKHIKRADKQMMLDLPKSRNDADKIADADLRGDVVQARGLPIGADIIAIKTEEKIVETVSEDKIKVNGSMTYKKTQKVSIANLGNAPVCPSCANMMILAEGCMKCDVCGYSKCG
ncbi:MAG: adenosylcobalamin-dependent ribonucleoside-diphosphate reductase [Candidatus Doudnabacteria bacterium]|nr:adenosylcobalamin-dependent ribonucleoside-diphosphate reductase [Candidatus Doudnabacteria bacterium]